MAGQAGPALVAIKGGIARARDPFPRAASRDAAYSFRSLGIDGSTLELKLSLL
jgi:hypothetical protein